MSAQADFHSQLEQAMGLAVDSACVLRELRTSRLPEPHRRLVSAAIGKLEWAQQIMFDARSDPWNQPASKTPQQLALL